MANFVCFSPHGFHGVQNWELYSAASPENPVYMSLISTVSGNICLKFNTRM